MIQIQEYIITSIVSSIATSSIIIFTLRIFLKKYIDSHFDIRKNREEVAILREDSMIKTKIPIYAELESIIYKLKVTLQVVLTRGTPLLPAKNDFQDCCFLLVESMVKFRLYIEPQIFQQIHSYKRKCQDAYLLLDISDRPEEVEKNNGRFSQEMLEMLRITFSEMEIIYEKATASIQNNVGLGVKR